MIEEEDTLHAHKIEVEMIRQDIWRLKILAKRYRRSDYEDRMRDDALEFMAIGESECKM